jgi:transposase InsO family protein
MFILRLVVTYLGSLFKSRRQLVLENLALKQQVAMLRQSVKRPTATAAATARLLPRACYRAPATARLLPRACYRASRSPWQNPYVERVIGSIRRDCLDHMIIINERHLRRALRNYFDYYHSCRTHLSLNKDPPDSRAVESVEYGNIVALPRVGGLHHRYTRIAA